MSQTSLLKSGAASTNRASWRGLAAGAVLVASGLSSLGGPGVVQADTGDFERFRKFLDKYYIVQTLMGGDVECGIELSNLKDLQAQLKNVPPAIQVTESSADFRVLYKKDGTVTFVNVPKIDFKVTSWDGVANKEQVEQGIKMTQTGYDMMVNGAKNVIIGVMKEFSLPKDSDLSGVQFTEDGKKGTLTFEKDGTKGKYEYNGESRHTHVENAALKADSEDSFTLLDGRLAYTKSRQKIVQGTGNHDITTEVQFEKLGAMSFPGTITSTLSSKTGEQTMTGKVSIRFKNCSVKK